MKIAWILCILLIISAALRIPGLNLVPPELFGDEVDVGYQAYSLLKTGKDIYRHPLPFYLQSLAEWRLPLIVYQTVPGIAAVGLNEWGVRLPEAIFGVLGPIILFLLVYHITKSKEWAFLSALALAFMPWHIMYSRMAAFGVVTLLNLLMIGTLLFFRKRFTLAAIFFVLTLLTYSSAIIFTPLLIISLIVITRQRPNFLASIIFVLSLLVFGGLSYVGHGSDRFSTLTIVNSKDVVDKIVSLRNAVGSPFEPIFHNKFESWARLFADNYMRAFSTDFLFVRGDPVGRHSIQVMGQLLPITAPILVLGIYYLVTRKQYLWLLWLIAAPIPSALTIDGGFHATRLFLMTLPLAVAIGAGLSLILQKQKFIFGVVMLVIVANFLWFGHFYAVDYPRIYSRWWQVGFKSSLTRLSQIESKYEHIFINNTYEPALIRFLFYMKYPPAEFHKQFTLDQPIQEIVPGYDGFTLGGKYYFGSFSTDAHLMMPETLYLISQRDDGPPRGGDETLFTAVDLANMPIFYLITKNSEP